MLAIAWANQSREAGSGTFSEGLLAFERLGDVAMVDLFGMFRRRPVKRTPLGFARSREDITALGDSMGEMLTSPVRDAPPLARGVASVSLDLPPAETPRPAPARSRPAARTNGAAAPRLTPRSGYLAVHSVEKSFGSRHVVRGVSI